MLSSPLRLRPEQILSSRRGKVGPIPLVLRVGAHARHESMVAGVLLLLLLLLSAHVHTFKSCDSVFQSISTIHSYSMFRSSGTHLTLKLKIREVKEESSRQTLRPICHCRPNRVKIMTSTERTKSATQQASQKIKLTSLLDLSGSALMVNDDRRH